MDNLFLLLNVLAVLAFLYYVSQPSPGSVETDRWLHQNAQQLGINPHNINPASVDVCLGGHIIEHTPLGVVVEHELDDGETFTFQPGHFYIAHSQEYTRCPTTHAWMLLLKSSTGRKGLDHLHAGWGDPGFEGQITFEFSPLKTVSFNVGDRIAQLVYLRLNGKPAESYASTGRYHGQTGATPARG